MKKTILLIAIVFALTAWSCSGPQKFKNKICKEVDGKQTECMSYELEVDSGLI